MPEHVETVAAWQALADKHSVSLAAVAIAFAALPVCVEKLVIGMRSVADVDRNVRQISEPVPVALWTEAQEQGLLRSELNLLPPDELSKIEACLAELKREIANKGGNGKRSILRVTFELVDLSWKPLLNDAWRAWVGDDSLLPARAVVGVGLGQEQMISASMEVAPASHNHLERHVLEPGLYHLAVVIQQEQGQPARVYMSGVSAELELGNDMMSTADLEVQTNAVLDRLERLLRDFEGTSLTNVKSKSLSHVTQATVYLVSSDWLVDEGVVRAVLAQRGVAPDCDISMVATADLGPSTLVEIIATAELPPSLAAKL